MVRSETIWAQNRRALVYRPEGVTAETPVMCFLHGHGEAAIDGQGTQQGLGILLAHGSPALHGELGLRPFARFLLVCPQLEVQREWSAADAADVRNLVEQVAERHGARQGRKVLTGFSFGGSGVFTFAALQPDYWTALWPVAPARYSPPPADRPVLIHYGRPDRRCPPLTSPPFQGDGSTRIHKVLLDGIPPSSHGHSQTCIAAYLDPDAHAWVERVLD